MMDPFFVDFISLVDTIRVTVYLTLPFFRSFGCECTFLHWSLLFVYYNTLHINHIQPLECQQKIIYEERKESFITLL
jgi:hypothetical protein